MEIEHAFPPPNTATGPAIAMDSVTPLIATSTENDSRNLQNGNSEYEGLPQAMQSHPGLDLPDSRRFLDMPSYICSSSHDHAPEGLAFLKARGALSIPESKFRDSLLLAFIQYIYLFMPVLDLQDFLDIIEGRSGNKVSLLLFQAVMFAGSGHVEIEHILNAGFKSRLALRAFLFQRVKLLYDFEWEDDRIILIQAILLHQNWYVATDEQKDPWHWLGVCISLAISVGLNQASTYVARDFKTNRLWRRLWWTCISRNRDICIAVHKPLRIKAAEINLPRLTFEDLDTQPILTEIHLLQNSPSITDSLSKVMLADMFMSKLELTVEIGRIMEQLYILKGFAGVTSKWLLFHAPKRASDLDVTTFTALQEVLDNWPNTLNNYCQMDYVEVGRDKHLTKQLVVHRASIRLLYLMAQEALHRPRSLSSLGSPKTSNADYQSSRSRELVKQASCEILDLLKPLREGRDLSYLPPLSVACILTAVASTVVEMRMVEWSNNDWLGRMEQYQEHYQECFRCLKDLQDVWPITKPTCEMARRMVSSNQTQTVIARNKTMLESPTTPTENTGHSRSSNEKVQPCLQGSPRPNGDLGEHRIPATSFDHDITPLNAKAWGFSTFLSTMYPISWTDSDLNYLDGLSFDQSQI